MISRRTSLSLVQYLALQECVSVGLLFEKHGLPYSGQISRPDAYGLNSMTVLSGSVTEATQDQIHAVLDEILRTKDDLRSRITPKSRHDQRFDDLKRCLFLDGFLLQGDNLVPQDPTIIEAPSVEDDLTQALERCGLPQADAVLRQFQKSADAFRNSPPNFNACLNDARVALQTLATSIAVTRLAKHPGNFDKTKWGPVLAYLRTSGFITKEEEDGFAGVFRFVSLGSHVPLGLSEMEMARLGRSFVAGMCWFMIKRFVYDIAQQP